MMRTVFAATAAAILLAGCAAKDAAPPEPTPGAPPPGDQATCGADKVAGYLGTQMTDEVLARIKAASGAQTIRVLGPKSMMTMDYRIERLTIETDEGGKITRLRCV